MPQEILSVAIYEPLPEMESASLATIHELMALLAAKGYSRDLIYRNGEHQFVLLRYWKSDEARHAAQEDPEVHRYWARLGNQIRIVKVYETLLAVPAS
jgi:hypothetical protein